MENMEKLEDVHICIQPQPHISETREKGGERRKNTKWKIRLKYA